MKKIIFLIFALFLFNSVFAQTNKWSSISYSYSKGPVSPEYQFNYVILINETGAGKLSYTKSSITNDYDFAVGKSGLKKLNKALKNSKVFVVSAEDMKADQNMIGGPANDLQITMWQAPNLDAKPTVIEVPTQVKPAYADKVNKLYDTINGLVPADIWDKVKSK